MNTKNITRTAILIALLVALQAATKPLANQFITGSCVNLVLAVAALFCGSASAAVVAVVSPFFAYLFGIAPQIWLAPAIALGNLVYVLILSLLSKSVRGTAGGIVSVVVGALCKFAVLFVVIVKMLIPMSKLPAPVAVQFSWPQIVTALIGGFLALVIVPVLKKAFKE